MAWKLILSALLLSASALAQTPDEPRCSWVVFGRVVDAGGNGIEGVAVHADCGLLTLMRTGSATTDSGGNYQLRFGPGWVSRDSSGRPDPCRTRIQVALIAVEKDGFFESSLSRQGDLRMAVELPADGNGERVPAERIVLPDQPRRVDFAMLPAASVAGRVLDARGQPLASADFCMDGDELPPGSSVFRQFTTDREGAFNLPTVPCKSYWFTPGARELRDVRSAGLCFSQPRRYEVELVLDSTKKRLLARMVAAPGSEVRTGTPPP
jgi:hypothetical protein